jgi:putative N6-adenine-specific DNA methylase
MIHQEEKPLPRLFATAARGTEAALRDELRELKFREVRADRGGVHFAGELDEGARACLWLRTALRVLYRLATFDAPDGGALYEGVRSIDWTPYLTARHTLAVRAVCRDSRLTHSQFIAQKTKDAIVDQIREVRSARPSVDLTDPDLTLFVHLVRDNATVYLDLSGESLHRRGYRTGKRAAPLKENLAAAIVRLSGWDRARPLLDPMCGAGTIPIEAALWARRIAPGLSRERFGFERWACHDAAAARETRALREAARAEARREGPEIEGSDVDPAALVAAEANAQAAGVTIAWQRRSVSDLRPKPEGGVIVTNPPYGERVLASSDLYQEMAQALSRMKGYRIALLAGTPAITRPLRLRPEASRVVYNGDIECRLLIYDLPR